MFSAFRISKKTFFAAAAASLSALVPAHAYLFEDDDLNWGVNDNGAEVANGIVRVDNDTADTYIGLIGATPWTTFVKTGNGILQVTSLGSSGGLFSQHPLGYSHDDDASNDGAYWVQDRVDGNLTGDVTFFYGMASGSRQILQWSSGELVVDEGTLNLTGYVNAWYDFGPKFNSNALGQTEGEGAMTGVSRITVRNGTVLDLSGNNSFREDNNNSNIAEMVVEGSYTTFQFLNNLQAGDTGTDINSALRLGTSTAFHVNLHVGGWNENERVDTRQTKPGELDTSKFDTQLAFGGSIGTIAGAGSIYKTGDGDFTLLGASTGFTGSLYAAGGSLILAADDSVGTTETFTDALGNTVRARVSSSVGNAASVNIAGTYKADGGSEQGSAIGSDEQYATVQVDPTVGDDRVTQYTAVKEGYFTTPDAGTLVIAENQSIKNFQSYFNAGYRVANGTSAAQAVLAAANDTSGVLSPMSTAGLEQGASDAPIIAGTGTGSSLVIPGGNYTRNADGSWTLNTDADGYMQGGLLVIEQQAGMGGIYEGSIVGARVTIYDKTTFNENTERDETSANLDNAARLEEVKVKDAIQDAVGLTDEEMEILDIAEDGSFALDNAVAWKVVEYYKNPSDANEYYIDYEADASVKGGLLVLKGAGDFALLAENANYSGIVIDPSRTGKTVLNIAAVNALSGTEVSLGGEGTVSFVVNDSGTLDVTLDGFDEGSRLVFTTADFISTVSGQIKVGDGRQANISSSLAQESIRGNVYIERGIGLNLNGPASTFTNAASVTLWAGSTAVDDAVAAPSLTLSPTASGYVNQFVHNFTGDASARVSIGSGALTVTTDDNAADGYSGLNLGTFNGTLSGAGTLVKDGDATLTLGGGSSNASFTGDVAVAAGSLQLATANRLDGAGAVILNAGTSLTAEGDQALRALYGSAEASVSVNGVLTLGANAAPATGEIRPNVSNNLGTSETLAAGDPAASFSRFQNCYDREGNLILADNDVPASFANQKEATSAYLGAVAKTAYSGYDASALRSFIGKENYYAEDKKVFTQEDYDALIAYAENGGRDGLTNNSGVDYKTLLGDLAWLYDGLARTAEYEAAFAPTATSDGYWSPAGMKNLFASTQAYNEYVAGLNAAVGAAYEEAYGEALPSNPTVSQKRQINAVLFDVLCEKYDELVAEKYGEKYWETGDYSYEALAGHFSGIEIDGGFGMALENADGTTVDASWIDDPAFAGTITATSFVKNGDGASKLTGTLNAANVVVNAGTLQIDHDTLAGTQTVSVARGSSLSVDAAKGTSSVFGYALSGAGNFVKTGEGKLTLGENVLYTGTTTLEAGTLQMSLRNPQTSAAEDGSLSTLSPQGNIIFAGSDTTLVLDQKTDVAWTNTIGVASEDDVRRITLEKIGAGALTISGDVSLGNSAALVVSEGALNLTGAVAFDGYLSIAEGATVSVATLDSDAVTLVGAGALDVAGAVSLSGASPEALLTAGTPGLSYEAFYGTVTVASGKGNLTLSGDSVLDHAREVAVRGTLNVASDQRVRALSGAGTVNIAENATLEIDRVGDRVGASWMTGGVAGDYAFSEGVFADAPNFAGTVSGAGTLEVSGLGVSRFSGAVGVNVNVSEGGQVVLDAGKFTGKVTVDGSSEKPVVADANGNRLVGAAGQNYSSGISAESGETGYLPSAFVTEDGETVDASSVALYTNEDGKPAYKDDEGKEHVVAKVSAWEGYVDANANGELSANRVLFDKDGNVISDWSSALAWDADKNAYVPAEGVTEGYVRLAEDASGNLVAADMSSTTTAVSEVIFSVAAAETANLDSEKLEITNGGYFGKAGDGSLSVNAVSFKDAGRVSVYEGTLAVDGWIAADKIIAEGATLGMTLGDSVAPDLNTVFGSGTLELTGSGNITLGGDGSKENSTAVLSPTPTADGKFFNGEISFKAEAEKDYTVNIASGTTLTAVSTDAGVSLVLNPGVKFVQSRDTEFSGDVSVYGFVTVEGADKNAGSIFDAAHRRLTISGTLSGVGGSETGALILKDVGFGFNASAPVDVRISGESLANAFYVNTAAGTDGGSSVGIAAGDAALSELSLIKSGGGSYALTGSEIASGASFFGVAIDARVLSVLANAGSGAVLNVGAEEGTLNIDLDGFTGTTGDGVNVDFVTLRSGTSAAAGTLEISATASSAPDAGTASLAAETVTAENGTTIFSETIKGSGNVVFDGSGNALKVNAAQTYTGTTTVSGNVAFEGDGRKNASSSFTVNADAELRGGVALTGREVTVSGTAVRNANADGSAGTTTLTLDISDPRLPSDLTCRVTLGGSGAQGDPVAVGTLPAGVEITGADYKRGEDGAAGTLSLTIKDGAFGETYTVSIPVNSSSLPSTAGGSSGVSGTATVAGKFTLDAGGSVVLDAATLGSDGFAGIDAGAGTVTLNGSLFVDNLNESTRGKTLTLVSAESISRKGGYTGIYAVVKALRDTNEEMADEADWMKLVVDVAADGSITAKMTTDNFSATGTNYGSGVSESFLSALSWLSSGGSYGAFGIVNMAEALEKDPQQYALMNALSGLSSDQLADEVEKLSPSGFASMLAMPVEAFNADVARIHERLDQRRYDGANPLRETGEYEFFVLAQGDVAENGSGADNPVFDYNLYGATAGVDWKPDYRSTLGLAFGYTYGKAKMRNGGGKVEMDDMRVTAFASRLIGDRFYVDGGLQAGTAMFDTRRETVAGSATGDTDAFFAGSFVTFGAVFTLSEDKKDGSGLYLMPNIGLSYLHESIDGFRESGTAGLDMDDADGDSLRARLAVALQWAFPFETWQVRLGVEAAYAHDFLGEDIDFDGRFTAGGNAFGTTAAALPTDVFSIGPTLDVGLTERDSLWLGYDLEIDTDSGVSHGFNAGYRHRF